MKKHLFFALFFTIVYSHVEAQLFEFPLYFKDAQGHMDTLIVGMHYEASESVDSAFGEMNIIGLPYKPGLDVRVTDEYQAYWQGVNALVHLKRQITFPTMPITIDLKTKNFPVTAYWDKSLFETADRLGSLFTSYTPGGWWDALAGDSNLGVVFFKNQDSVTFTNNVQGNYFEHAGYEKNNDTIPVFWIALGPEGIGVATREPRLNMLEITPNPTDGIFEIRGLQNEEIAELEIWTAGGLLCKKLNYKPSDKVDVSDFYSGMYFCRIKYGKEIYSKRFIIF